MHCEKAEMLLAQMVFGEVDAAGAEPFGNAQGTERSDAEGLSAHLAECRTCAALLADMRVAAGLVREGLLGGPAPTLSDERRAALLAKATEVRTRRPAAAGRTVGSRGDSWRILGVSTAAAAAALLAGMLIREGDGGGGWGLRMAQAPGPCAAAPRRHTAEPATPSPVSHEERTERDPFRNPVGSGLGPHDDRSLSKSRQADDRSIDVPLGGADVSGSIGIGGEGLVGAFGFRDGRGPRRADGPPAEAKEREAPPTRDLSSERNWFKTRAPDPADPGASQPDSLPKPVITVQPSAEGRPGGSSERSGSEDALSDAPPDRRRAETEARRKWAAEESGDREAKLAEVRKRLEKSHAAAPDAPPPHARPMFARELAAERLVKDGKKAESGRLSPDGEKLQRKPFIVLGPDVGQDPVQRQQQQQMAQGRAEVRTQPSQPVKPPELPPEKPPAAPDPEDEARLGPGAVFKVVPVNPFVMAAQDRLSTFALDVDTASYSIARRYIRGGYLPPVGAVRMEEFVNAFDYNYPRRTEGVFTVISEAAPAPFGQDLVLLKVGVRGRVVGREGRKPAHLVFVVDASGSMAQPDRMPLVKYALAELVGQLGAADRVSLVAYGTKARLVLDGAAAGDRKAIIEAIDGVQCEGSTNLSEGLALGYRLAARGFIPGGVNRVILCSDGAANIGITAGEDILDGVRAFREKGVTCASVGFGAGTYNDALLEKLANSGDGSYVFVDSRREARRVFVEEMSATLQTIARDARIQVEFDPRRVRRYRLIGYENRDIADERFRDDTVDAGEVGSGQSATALYELELQGAAEADLGTVYVRYRDADSGRVEELSHRLEAAAVRARTPESDPRFYLAACAAEFAELLRGSEHAAGGSFDALRAVLEQVAAQPALRADARVQELLELVRRAKGLPRAE